MSAHKTEVQAALSNITGILIPMLFAAIRALLRTNPSYNHIPEVKAALSLEPFVTSTTSATRHCSGAQQIDYIRGPPHCHTGPNKQPSSEAHLRGAWYGIYILLHRYTSCL